MVIDFLLTIGLTGVGISALVVGHRIPIVKTLTKFGINRVLFGRLESFMPRIRCHTI